MLINGEKVYLYSPFDVKRWTDQEIEKEVATLIKEYNPDADTMYLLSNNVEILANIQYLYGEMISRITHEYEMLKLQVGVMEDKAAHTLRSSWIGDGKAPAMSYFEAQARELAKDEREKMLMKYEMLTRFKFSYDSYEAKINAIKKKIESIRYEEFGGMNG